jgi:hypothetical protein
VQGGAVGRQVFTEARRVTPDRDPKIAAVVAALEKIAVDAEREAITEDDARQKRKVIVFSFFADTVSYLREELAAQVKRNPKLACLSRRGRASLVLPVDLFIP